MGVDPEVAKGLLDIENEMRRMLDGQSQPYDAGWKIWSKAMSLVSPSSNLMHGLWLIWGALTDWVENRRDETPQAESKMRQAAKEWLELNRDDPNEEKAYLDRWVYDEMGYARPQTKPKHFSSESAQNHRMHWSGGGTRTSKTTSTSATQ